MKSKIIFLLSAVAALTVPAGKAMAVCPVCTVAVGAGVGLSRWLGIDDSITGLWIGAFALSAALWTIDWLSRKNIRSTLTKSLVIMAYYAMVIVPLYYTKIADGPKAFLNIIGEEKLLLGIIEGSAAFFFGTKLYEFLKQRNDGHAHFPYEKVVLPVAAVIIFTILFYFLTK